MGDRGRCYHGLMMGLGLAGMASLAAGCVFVVRPRVTYGDTLATVSYPGDGVRVAVAAQDRREYILSGQTEATYVGQSRGQWGIPFNQHTESGLPLASDLSHAVSQAMQRAGFVALPVVVEPKDAEVVLRSKLMQAEAARMMVITIHEWMYDRYKRYTNLLTYKLEVEVLDAQGQRLASALREDERQIGRPAVLEYADLLLDLLHDPEISAALQLR